MTDVFRLLSDEEVRQIGRIVENLDNSTFDFLQLEFGDVKLTIGKGNAPPAAGDAPNVLSASPGAVPPTPLAAPAGKPAAASPTPAATDDGAREGTVDIVAPLLGRFYAQPEPGAPPFVAVGSEVTEDTTVGLIEVMKTFNAVPAGVSGVVTEICVGDAQFVEYGQALLRVRPKKV